MSSKCKIASSSWRIVYFYWCLIVVATVSIVSICIIISTSIVTLSVIFFISIWYLLLYIFLAFLMSILFPEIKNKCTSNCIKFQKCHCFFVGGISHMALCHCWLLVDTMNLMSFYVGLIFVHDCFRLYTFVLLKLDHIFK